MSALRPVGGGDICAAYRAVARGQDVFVKVRYDAPPGFFAAEVAGLEWLAGAGRDGVPVPAVLAFDEQIDDEVLVLRWLERGEPTAAAAERLGRALAVTHRAGAARFGAPWPGYIGTLPLDNTGDSDWPQFYATRRLLPYLRLARDRDAVDPVGARLVETVAHRLHDLAGPPEPPRRLHGDLWSGNVVWTADGNPALVDPAAHGGHRETDLAMLDLFGLPQLDRVLTAYDEAFPLAAGWRSRVCLHQLHPVLVHAALFGGSYGAWAVRLARSALR